ncbi:hypothetical protein GF327_10120 [Candidatus Woesearchaeota archaeon]|nr:hypothetical protein [Candidatus Woesearchaeota archaeon]
MIVIYENLLKLSWYRENLKKKYGYDFSKSFKTKEFMENIDREIYRIEFNPVFLKNYSNHTLPITRLK